jgi:hypothetical protein
LNRPRPDDTRPKSEVPPAKTQNAGVRSAAASGRLADQQSDRGSEQDEDDGDLQPGGAPAIEADRCADRDERACEHHAEKHRIRAHRDADLAIERLADHRKARHRQRALTDGARGQHEDEEHQRAARDAAHRPDDGGKRERQRHGRAAQADTIEHAADGKADDGTEQRGPQIEVRVSHAIELQVAQHRLGDQTEPLRAAGQRRDHDHRADDDVGPAGPVDGSVLDAGVDRCPGARRHRKKVEVLPYSA